MTEGGLTLVTGPGEVDARRAERGEAGFQAAGGENDDRVDEEGAGGEAGQHQHRSFPMSPSLCRIHYVIRTTRNPARFRTCSAVSNFSNPTCPCAGDSAEG